MATEVVMPQMGESIAEGTITRWLKKVGERVERDEPLFEISTDKVDAEIPSPAAGTHGARTAAELRRTRSSPLVRKIAAEHGIDISRLEGTGASGRVTKNDILSYSESGEAAQTTAAPPTAAPSFAEAPAMRGP